MKNRFAEIFSHPKTGMEIKSVLLDIDGTLFTGKNPIPGAAASIRYLRDHNVPFRFISNGTRKARKSVLEKIRCLNLPVREDQIITPAVAAIRYLLSKGYTSCTLLASDELREDFTSGGICLTDNAPVIVIGDAGDNFTYSSINRVFRQIMDGAHLIALEKDRYWMDEDALSLGAGAFIAGIEYASGVSAVLMGKPSPEFFDMAIRSMGAEPETTVMVGDDIISDVGGAKSCGLIGIQVMTGKYNPEAPGQSRIRPDQVIPSIASLPDLIR